VSSASHLLMGCSSSIVLPSVIFWWRSQPWLSRFPLFSHLDEKTVPRLPVIMYGRRDLFRNSTFWWFHTPGVTPGGSLLYPGSGNRNVFLLLALFGKALPSWCVLWWSAPTIAQFVPWLRVTTMARRLRVTKACFTNVVCDDTKYRSFPTLLRSWCVGFTNVVRTA